MTAEEVGGLVRTVLAALGGVAVGRGWVDGGTMTMIAGAVGTLVVAVWSIVQKRRAAASTPSV